MVTPPTPGWAGLNTPAPALPSLWSSSCLSEELTLARLACVSSVPPLDSTWTFYAKAFCPTPGVSLNPGSTVHRTVLLCFLLLMAFTVVELSWNAPHP